jgi:hypothetical protein
MSPTEAALVVTLGRALDAAMPLASECKPRSTARPCADHRHEWPEEAPRGFTVPKPAHFTNYRHCCECAEHDDTLVASDVDAIGLQQLGHPGWDPSCFAAVEGLLYYLPALIRLTLETMDTSQERYLDQLLFHLMRDGKDNDLVRACSPAQRAFIAGFLTHLMEQYSVEIDEGVFRSADMLKA